MMRVAALTSYSTDSIEVKIEQLVGAGISTIDVYCFQPEDLPGWTDQGARLSDALLRLNPSAVAARLIGACKRAGERAAESGAAVGQIDICGLASFFPDVCSSIRGDRARAVDSICWLVELAGELRADYSCKTVELVAGHTIIRSSSSTETKAFLQHIAPGECFKRLRTSLELISRKMERVFNASTSTRIQPPLLAFEVEPSSSKLVHDEPSLRQLVELVQDLPHVGINVDIGHALIVGIGPQEIFDTDLARRVVHAHISDNAHSHFADLPPGAFNSKDIFADWINRLVLASKKGLPMYQGTISVELEACQDVSTVRAAHQQTREWVEKSLNASPAPMGPA